MYDTRVTFEQFVCTQLYNSPTCVYYKTFLGQAQDIKNLHKNEFRIVGMKEKGKLANLTLVEFKIVHQFICVE